MANTPNLDLVKPAGTDHALVSVINSNSDKIDAGFGTLSEQIEYTTITSGSFNSYTGNNGHTLYYKGSDISQFTDIPSATSGNAWPFVLEVIKMGPYAKQILHVFTTPTKMNNPPTFIRQQTYQSGSIVWGGWYSVDEKIAPTDLGSFSTLGSLESALNTLGAQMAVGECRTFRFTLSAAVAPFTATTGYVGQIFKVLDAVRYRAVIYQNGTNTEFDGIQTGESWKWQSMYFSGNYTTGFEIWTNDTSAVLTINGKTKKFVINIASNGTITGSVTNM